MKRTIATAILAFAMTTAALAGDWMKAADFQWPDHYCPVLMKNYVVRVGWVDGHPMGERQDCAPLLNLPMDGPSIELEKVLVEKNFMIRMNGGTIEIKAGPGSPIER